MSVDDERAMCIVRRWDVTLQSFIPIEISQEVSY